MPFFEWNDVKLEMDEDGFVRQPELWNEQMALALASTEGLCDLSDSHWKVVRYIRNYYLQNNVAPMVRKLCQDTGYSLKQIYELFPSGPSNGACKVAGLAKPTGCV